MENDLARKCSNAMIDCSLSSEPSRRSAATLRRTRPFTVISRNGCHRNPTRKSRARTMNAFVEHAQSNSLRLHWQHSVGLGHLNRQGSIIALLTTLVLLAAAENAFTQSWFD